MAGVLVRRSAMGELAAIGTLYDSKTDRFFRRSLFTTRLPLDAITTTLIHQRSVESSFIDSYEEKMKQMSIESDLGASILAGISSPSGCGLYLDENYDSEQYLHAAIYYKFASLQENLNMLNSRLESCLSTDPLRASEATHVVISIEWGIQSIVTATQIMADEIWIARSKIESQFRAEIQNFKSSIESSQPFVGRLNEQGSADNHLVIMAYSDIRSKSKILVHSFQDAHNFLNLAASHLESNNNGKGFRTTYTLIPINMLAMFLQFEVSQDIIPGLPSNECLKSFTELFDQFRVTKQSLARHQKFVQLRRLYIFEEQLLAVEKAIDNIVATEDHLRIEYGRLLQNVRGGSADPEKLWQLFRDMRDGELSPSKIRAVVEFRHENLSFVDDMVRQGVSYIGYNRLSLRNELSRRGNIDAYVLWFNEAARVNDSSWKSNEELILKLLVKYGRQSFIAIVDCDATGDPLDKTHISHFRNQKELHNDLLEQTQFLIDKCFARCSEPAPETKKFRRPVKRRFVKTTCPGINCNQHEICEWICCHCLGPIEYGYTDDYIHCDCGRSIYTSYDFKCRNPHHGIGFNMYEPDAMLRKLKALDVPDYLNVLILGETGVGKSTFINAFVNYVTFGTLDEAMKAEELEWLIPCSFSVQTMDRSRPDSKINQTEISVGKRSDEKDGSKGASATKMWPPLECSSLRII